MRFETDMRTSPAGTFARRTAVAMARVAAIAALIGPPAQAQTPTYTAYPPVNSYQNKAPLGYQDSDLKYNLLEMQGSGTSASVGTGGRDWSLQPMFSQTTDPTIPSWMMSQVQGGPVAGPIYAYGGNGPPAGDLTNYVDWGDGSFLRVSATAASYYGGMYGLNAGTILYSTRLNTACYLTDANGKNYINPNGYGIVYRIVVFMSQNNGVSWTYFPGTAPAVSTVTAEEVANGAPFPNKGLWSNFLFERSDGQIQLYFDDEATPYSQGYGGQQWQSMTTLGLNASQPWGPGRANLPQVTGTTVATYTGPPGGPSVIARAGEATVSEGVIGGVNVMILTQEDISSYAYENPGTNPQYPAQYPNGTVIQFAVCRVWRSTDGGQTWTLATTFAQVPNPQAADKNQYMAYNDFAPSHIRSKVTGDLIIVFRSDIGAANTPQYDPFVAFQNPQAIAANIYTFVSHPSSVIGQNGVNWTYFPDPRNTAVDYIPSGSATATDPGVIEITPYSTVPVTPTSSYFVFQWGQTNPSAPGTPVVPNGPSQIGAMSVQD